MFDTCLYRDKSSNQSLFCVCIGKTHEIGFFEIIFDHRLFQNPNCILNKIKNMTQAKILKEFSFEIDFSNPFIMCVVFKATSMTGFNHETSSHLRYSLQITINVMFSYTENISSIHNLNKLQILAANLGFWFRII